MTNPPASYDGGGQKGAMWMLQYKAFLLYKKLGHVLQPRFNATLPTTKAEVLVVGTNDVAIKAQGDSNLTIAILTMVMETPAMLNMIMFKK